MVSGSFSFFYHAHCICDILLILYILCLISFFFVLDISEFLKACDKLRDEDLVELNVVLDDREGKERTKLNYIYAPRIDNHNR